MRRDEKEYGVEGQTPSRFIMFKEPPKFWMVATPAEIKTNTFRCRSTLALCESTLALCESTPVTCEVGVVGTANDNQ